MLLVCGMAAAAQSAGPGPGSADVGMGDQQQVQNQTVEQLQNQTMAPQQGCGQEIACDGDQLRQMVQQRDQELTGEGQQTHERATVQVAFYAFEASEDLVGPQGGELVRLGEQANASFQIAYQAEEQIRKRSSIMRMLFGGDRDAAGEILQEMEQNQNRIAEMNRIIQECDFDPQVKVVLQDQVRNLEQEQSRLLQQAQDEQDDTGLLGWLFR